MNTKPSRPTYQFTNKSLYLDYPLLSMLLLLAGFGLIILYSASNQDMGMILRQSSRLLFAFSVLFVLSFIPPHQYQLWTPSVYMLGLALLVAVIIMGKVGKGAQRWLDLSLFRFQPSEIMKLAVPMMTAWYVDRRPISQDPLALTIAAAIIFIPSLLIAKQPDLGTALMVMASGVCVIFLAGISTRIILFLFAMTAAITPLLWHMLHSYQKHRILTLLNPERDPLGTGYHIIQSKIAIGSGGAFGKGLLEGTQSHLSFLPEHATDFIFAVSSEEFGFAGGFCLISLLFLISWRSLSISKKAQTEFTRLLAAGLAMIFFLSAFVNIGMVTGLLPVVGIPLPLISYGGTAMVTLLASFGILMSISTHHILFNTIK